MVSSTGMTCPMNCWVASLYWRQNSMMFTPCWPSAVPTGGAGVACPARICSLTKARTFLRLRPGGVPFEDVHQHLQLGLLHVDLGDRPLEVGERAGDDPDHVALLPLQPVLGLLL